MAGNGQNRLRPCVQRHNQITGLQIAQGFEPSGDFRKCIAANSAGHGGAVVGIGAFAVLIHLVLA